MNTQIGLQSHAREGIADVGRLGGLK